MGGEKIKETTRTAIIESLSQGQRVSRAHVLGILEGAWAETEAAEQEEWKGLPHCTEERQKLIAQQWGHFTCPWPAQQFCPFARRYKDYRCDYYIGEFSDPDDTEPDDTEPDTERERHWQERAVFHAEGLINLKATVDNLEEQVTGFQGDYLLHIDKHRDGQKETDAAFSDTLKGYLERLEKVDTELGILMDWHAAMRRKQADDQLNKTMEGEG